MKQFQVPQFITIEDKAIGGILTIKQFLFIAGGAALIAFLRFLLPRILFFPAAAIIAAGASALAFLKVSGRPATTVFKNVLLYAAHPRLYIWRQRERERPGRKKERIPPPRTTVKAIPKLSSSKLSDLAWSLDIKSREHQQ